MKRIELTAGARDAGQISELASYKKTDPGVNEMTWYWVNTKMYMQINHEVAPATAALRCNDCHLDSWEANFGDSANLGYLCDPMTDGGTAACAP